MDKLLIQKGDSTLKEVPLKEAVSIGRSKDNIVQLEDQGISRLHAIVTKQGGGYFVEDLGSVNGTLVNRIKIDARTPTPIMDGDEVGIENYVLKISCVPEERGTIQAAPSDEQTAADISKIKEQFEQPPEPSMLMSHLLNNKEFPVWCDGELEVQVADIIEETHDAKTFRLVGKEPTLFSYMPGQFITLTVNIDGEDVKRSYSISSSPSRPHTMELTIKRVPDGLVSNWVANNLKLGDTLKVRGPAGKFSCFNYPSRKMLYIAAGSGITPLMSMSRWIVDTTADVDVVFLVSAKTPSDIIYRKELEQLSARHSSFRVYFTVTSAWGGTEGWTGLSGRVDQKMLGLIAPDLMDRHVFLCGPKPFADATKEHLKQMGYPMEQYHTESFGGPKTKRVAPGTDVPAQPAPQAAPAAATAAPAAAASSPAVTPAPAGFAVKFSGSGVDIVTTGEETILDLAEANGVDISYACRMGACGSCKTRCSEGSIDMGDVDFDEDERAEGWFYACVGKPTSSIVVEA